MVAHNAREAWTPCAYRPNLKQTRNIMGHINVKHAPRTEQICKPVIFFTGRCPRFYFILRPPDPPTSLCTKYTSCPNLALKLRWLLRWRLKVLAHREPHTFDWVLAVFIYFLVSPHKQLKLCLWPNVNIAMVLLLLIQNPVNAWDLFSFGHLIINLPQTWIVSINVASEKRHRRTHYHWVVFHVLFAVRSNVLSCRVKGIGNDEALGEVIRYHCVGQIFFFHY